MDGMLTDVTVLPRGSSAIAAQSVGDTTVTVEDVTNFATTVDPTDPGAENVGRLDICGVQYDYTAVDPATGIITLATPLTVAVADSDPVVTVAGGEVLQDWTAVVDPGEGDNLEIPMGYAFRALIPEGHYDPPVPVVVSDDLTELLDAPGRQPVLPAAAIDPTTLPDRQPTAPPDDSPTIRAYGDSSGITLVVDSIDQATVLDFYIDGVLTTEPQGLGTRSTVVRLSLDSTGSPFVGSINNPDGTVTPAKQYAFTVVARNIVGSAAASDPVTASLDMGVSPDFVIGKIMAGFVLAGQVQVGNITIDPAGGITIPLADGGLIKFPADGSPATITAILAAYKLVVMDKLTIQGANNLLAGLLTIQSSWVAPKNAPAVSGTMDNVRIPITGIPTSDIAGFPFGNYDSTRWWLLTVTAASTAAMYLVNKTTGAATLDPNFTQAVRAGTGGSYTRLGTSWYVLYPSPWTVKIYDSNWVQTGTIASGSLPQTDTAMMIGNDGTNLLFNRRTATVVESRSPSTGALVSSKTYTFASNIIPLGGLFDYTTTRWLTYGGNGVDYVRSYTVSGSSMAEQTTERFAPVANQKAASWDPTGTAFWAMCQDASGNKYLCKYSSLVLTTARSVTWTRYDNVGTPHESKPSPASAFSQTARQWMRIETDALPALPDVDDPNSVRIYVGNQLQTSAVTGQTAYTYGTTTSGAAAPTSEGFPAGSPKQIASQDTDANGPLLQFKGNGDYRLAGKNLDDTAWVNLTHQGSAGTVSWRRHNGLFELRVIATMSVANATKVTLVTTANGFPVGTYPLPQSATYMPIYGGFDSFFAGNVILNADGSIDLYQTSGATRAAVRAYINWPIT